MIKKLKSNLHASSPELSTKIVKKTRERFTIFTFPAILIMVIISGVFKVHAAVPAAPTALVATPSDVSVSIAFTPPTGTITNYQYSIDNGATFTAFSPVDNASPVVITGLACGTVYQIKLKAINSSGAGTASAVVSATTTIAAPTSLVATPTTTSASIAFTAPSGTMTNYQYSTNGGTSYTACSPAVTGSPITISGLTSNTSYQVMLKAQNATGVGAASTALTVTTLPAAPTALVATPSINSVSIAFTKPAGTITNYQYSIDNGVTFTACSPVVTTSPVTISGLSGGTAYQAQLKAVNSSGAGTASGIANFTTILGPPTNLVATPSFNSVSIAFTTPSGIISYYQYSIDNGTTYITCAPAGPSSPVTIMGLASNTTYKVLLKTVNATGVSASSSAITFTTTLAAPTNLVSTAGEGSTSIAFTPPTGTVTNYQYSIDGGVTFTACSPVVTKSPIVINGLNGSTSYQVVLKAVNSAGVGAASAVVNATYYGASCSDLNFNGINSYVSFATPIPATNTFTIEAWIKTMDKSTISSIFSWSTSASSNTNLQLLNYYGGLGFSYSTASGTSTIYTTDNYWNDNWHHVAVTQNGSNVNLYVDGYLMYYSGSINIPSTIANWNRASIGATILQNGTASSFFKGAIQDIRVWNVERSLADIVTYKDVTLSGAEPGLVAYYKMRGSLVLANSVSGGFYTGTLNNTTWINSLAPTNLINSLSGQSGLVNVPFNAISSSAYGRDLQYQWYINTTPNNSGGISLGSDNGAQTDTYTPQASLATVGTNYYYCVVGRCFTTVSPVSGAFIVETKIPAPTSLVATSGNGSVSIEFVEPKLRIIKNYEYSIDNGISWLSSGMAKSPVTITGLSNCTSYSIKLRAVNDIGTGYESEAVTATPINGTPAGYIWTGSAIGTHNWSSVTYGNGMFVAVAFDGSVISSTDGILWTNRTAPEANSWRAVTFGNGQFVAVANGGVNGIMTSPDGINWTSRYVVLSGLTSVTFGNGLYVAVAAAGTGTARVTTSPDGINWTTRASSQVNAWQSVTYGNGLFVAVSNSGTKRVMTSPDGITWTARSSANERNTWQSVTYGNGLFVAVALTYTGSNQKVMTSADGFSWNAQDLDGNFNGVTYGNGQFVVLGSSINSSADGINWTQRYADLNQWQCVTYGKDWFVAVSSSGDNRAISSTFAAPYSSPILNSITTGDASASVAFTEGASNGGSGVSNYQYSIDNGTNWITPSPVINTSPMTISGLNNGTTYQLVLRALNSNGSSCQSNMMSFSPVAPCYNPTDGGIIASDQNGMGPFNPAAFTNITGATGQTGTLEYKWVASTTSNSGGFNNISSSNSVVYSSGALNATTWFKRLARVSCAADWSGAAESNVLTVTVAPEPAAQPTNLNFSNTVTDGNTNIVVNYTASATATGYLVVRNTGSAPTFVPEDGTTYTTGMQGSDQIIYVGPATTATDLTITKGTRYFYAIYAFIGSGSNCNYLTTNPLNGSTTCALNNTNTLPASPGIPVSAGFPDAGINVTFPNGTGGTSLTATKTSSTPFANFSVLPGVRGVSNLYLTITSSESAPGTFVLVLDFSSLGLAQNKWASFKIMKRSNSTAPWVDITSLGGSITNRCPDGVWGKFTVSGLSSFSDFAMGEEATVHIVTSAAESAATVGTLKYCIANAVAGDFISFNLTSMGTNTIKLTSPVVIDKDLTIQGAASGIVLDGNNATKVMEISSASDPQPVVRMEKLTITKGNDAANVVGGINNSGDLFMVNCLVIDNADTGVNGGVGAIGGIYSTGNLTLINTTVAGNAGATSNGGIGGICLIEPIGKPRTLKLYNSIFYGNTGEFHSMAYTTVAESYNSLYEETLDVLQTDNFNLFIQGTPVLDNKFESNPKFIGKANNATHPYMILGISPCVDSGNDTYNFDDTDIRGAGFGRKLSKDDVTIHSPIDIGAYEWKKSTDPNNIFTWTGTSGTDWATAGNWDVNAVPQPEDIVTIPNVANQPVAGALAVSASGKLTIQANSSVTTTGALVNNGTIIIRSDINGTGSLITSENATGSGQALVERYMSKNQWHIISSPAGTQTIGNFLADNIDIPIVSGTTPVQYGMMDYNTATNNWNPYFTDATSGTLGIGKGYMVRVEEPVQTLRFQGILNATTTTNVSTGWNCIGNPFTSAIRIIGVGGSNNFIGANAGAFETSYGALYFWNQASTKYDVVTLGDLSGFNASVGQGFFMKAKSGATSVSFTPAMQVNSNDTPFKATGVPIPSIQLIVESGSKKVSTDIRFVEGTTKGLDFGYDAGLFTTDKSFTLYTKLVDDNGVDFQLQCLPTNQYKDLVIPVGIDSKSGGEIVFSVKTVQLDQTCTVVLEDKLTNTFTNLSTGSYKATVAANTAGTGRFFLHTADIISGSDDQVLPGKLTAYVRGNTEIRVIGEVGNDAVATLVNGLGQVVLTKKLESGNLNIIGLPNLSSGVYLLNIKDKGTPQTIKVMVRK